VSTCCRVGVPIVGVGSALTFCKFAEYTKGKGLGHLNTFTRTITIIIVLDMLAKVHY
jgi:hypothetical protein